jgi:NAD+ dependent glucose-6-phosphate dehydrogenase
MTGRPTGRAPGPTSSAASRVLVTGADGVIGGVVRRHLVNQYQLSYLTRRAASFGSHVGNIADLASILPAFEGIDAVIHLAASSSVDASWEEILSDNIVGTYNIFEAAVRAGVSRVVFASSNHTVGMYEVEGAPGLYDAEDPRSYGTETPLRPDSLYGVSKIFGEAIGRLYADRHGLSVICLRIGAVREHDDPTNASDEQTSLLPGLTADQLGRRLRAVWLSHRDCAQLIRRALQTDTRFAVVYGVSNNPGRFWDLDGARDLIGYEPLDAAPA